MVNSRSLHLSAIETDDLQRARAETEAASVVVGFIKVCFENGAPLDNDQMARALAAIYSTLENIDESLRPIATMNVDFREADQ